MTYLPVSFRLVQRSAENYLFQMAVDIGSSREKLTDIKETWKINPKWKRDHRESDANDQSWRGRAWSWTYWKGNHSIIGIVTPVLSLQVLASCAGSAGKKNLDLFVHWNLNVPINCSQLISAGSLMHFSFHAWLLSVWSKLGCPVIVM